MGSESCGTQHSVQKFASNRSQEHECTCERRVKKGTAISLWGSSQALIGSGVVSKWAYDTQCHIHGFEAQDKLIIALILPRWLVSTAIKVSFACSRGAGGCSIAASLSTDFVVGLSSPVMQLIHRRRYRWGNYIWREERLSSLIHQLRQLFLERKASRLDVDSEGNNYIGVSDRLRLFRQALTKVCEDSASRRQSIYGLF